MAGNQDNWSSIVASVKTKIGLFALLVLAGEAILGALAIRASGVDLTIIIIGMFVILFALIVAVSIDHGKRDEVDHNVQSRPIYDVFISAPMAAFDSDEEFKKNRDDVMRLIKVLQQEYDFKAVVYAGNAISSIQDFNAPGPSSREDINAIRDSKFFILWYPDRLVSSVIFEAGVALAYNKPSIYFVSNRKHLPFLMQSLDNSFGRLVAIHEVPGIENIVKTVKNNRKTDLFPPGE